MKTLIKNLKGESIAFSIFIMVVIIILFAIISFAVAPIVQTSVNFNNEYAQNNPEKYLPECHRNQADGYRYFEAFPIVLLITVGVWIVVNAIRRDWEEKTG